MRATTLISIVLAVAILGGCSGKKEWPKASVTGQVTYKGKPLDHGRVVFIHEQGHGGAGEIGADGRYTLQAILGPNRVMIECKDPHATTTDPGRPNMPIPANFIPDRYTNHVDSGLTAEVREGENTEDFDLVD